MSKTKQNVPKSKRLGYELWGKKPLSMSPHTSTNKKISRRIHRKQLKEELLKEEYK